MEDLMHSTSQDTTPPVDAAPDAQALWELSLREVEAEQANAERLGLKALVLLAAVPVWLAALVLSSLYTYTVAPELYVQVLSYILKALFLAALGLHTACLLRVLRPDAEGDSQGVRTARELARTVNSEEFVRQSAEANLAHAERLRLRNEKRADRLRDASRLIVLMLLFLVADLVFVSVMDLYYYSADEDASDVMNI